MWWAKLELWIKWLTSLLDWRDLLRRLLRGLLRGLFSSTSILRDMSSTRLRLRASLSPPLRKSISESTWKSENNALMYICLPRFQLQFNDKVLLFWNSTYHEYLTVQLKGLPHLPLEAFFHWFASRCLFVDSSRGCHQICWLCKMCFKKSKKLTKGFCISKV